MRLEKTQQASYRQLVLWAWRHVRGVRLRLSLTCLCGLLRITAGLSFIWVSKTLIDTAVAGAEDSSVLWLLSGFMVALMLFETAMSLIGSYLSSQTEVLTKNKMQREVYASLLENDYEIAGQKHSGDMLNRLIEDVRVITDAICNSFPNLVVMLAQLIAAFWLLYQMTPTLALCIVGIMPVCLLLSKLYLNRMRNITADVRQCDSRIHEDMQEGLQHRVVVQVLECQPHMSKHLAALQNALYKNVMRRTRFNTFSRSMIRLGFISGYLITFLWSIWHLHSGAITFGMMTAFLQLVSRIENPILNLSHMLPSVVRMTTSIDRLMEITDNAEDASEPRADNIALTAPLGISIKNITFAYRDAEKAEGKDTRNIFSDFSFDFKPANSTVIMGETGVGKSTLTKIILALLHPQSGEVNIYDGRGHSIAVSRATRHYMTYVPQGNSLFNMSVRDNLLIGNPKADEVAIKRALEAASANFVYELPQGLDTICGEQGSHLSEGQCQRIAIARALLRNSPIMILDEFNSSLDLDTANDILRHLSEDYPDCTKIFISHRPEVITYCQTVLTLK